MCNYRCVDGVGSRSILRLFIPSTQLDEGVVVEDSTNSFFTPTMQLDEVGIVMHIVESRLLRGEPPPCELHTMFTNLIIAGFLFRIIKAPADIATVGNKPTPHVLPNSSANWLANSDIFSLLKKAKCLSLNPNIFNKSSF